MRALITQKTLKVTSEHEFQKVFWGCGGPLASRFIHLLACCVDWPYHFLCAWHDDDDVNKEVDIDSLIAGACMSQAYTVCSACGLWYL